MNTEEMVKIAEELEVAANGSGLTLEKVASAALLYESFGMDSDKVDDGYLKKVAAQQLAEEDLGIELGISMAIDSFLKAE